MEARALQFASWAALLPETIPVPVGGRGDAIVSARGTGRHWQSARLRLQLGNLALRGVAQPFTRVAGDVQLRREAGRLTIEGTGIELSRPRHPWKPTTLLAVIETRDGALSQVSTRADYIRIDNLTALAPLLPEGRARELVMALDTRGEVTAVDLVVAPVGEKKLPDIRGRARFKDLGFEPWGRAPGVTGLDGSIEGRGAGGVVTLAVKDATLAWPMRWRATADIKSMDGRLQWTRVASGVQLALDEARVDVGHGVASGRLRMLLRPGQTPLMDLKAEVSNADATQTWRWLPIDKMTDKSLAWLDAAFRRGRVTQGTVEITGPVKGFPYRAGEGLFRAQGRVEDLDLFYAPDWPEAKGITADVTFDGPSVRAVATRGTIGGIAIEVADATSADLREAMLGIRARAAGDLGDALAFLRASPLAESLGAALQDVEGRGPMSSEVALYLPLKEFSKKSVTVQATFNGVALRFPGQPDLASRVSGSLWVRDRELQAPALRGNFMGGPGQISIVTTQRAGGGLRTRVEGAGKLEGKSLQSLARLPANGGIAGSASWRGSLQLDRARDTALPAKGSLNLESDLKGLTSGLPAPLAKVAEESLPLAISAEFGGVAAPRLRARLGRNVHALLQWRRDPRDPPVERGIVLFGGSEPETLPAAQGLWLQGRLESASLSDLVNLEWEQPKTRELHEWLAGADLSVGRFEALGFEFRDVSGVLRPGNRAWDIEVTAPALQGRLVVPHAFPGEVPLVLDLARLHVGAAVRPGEGDADPRKLPAIHFDIRDLLFDSRQFGHARGEMTRGTAGLTLNHFSLQHAAFSASGQGSWLLQDGQARCRVEVELDSNNVRGLMVAMNLGTLLAGKRGKLSAQVNWPGAPDGGFLERLSGQLRIEADDGELTSVQPGAGRVLGLMSLAHLPRRLALDFGDLTGEGLAFDTLRGDFTLRDGEATTNNLTLRGSAADIGMAGTTSLKNRSYDQTAVVTGQLGASLGVAGALAGGPVVGAALLLFSQIFKEPLKGATRGYYRITGSWDDPQVKRIDAREMKETQAAPAASATPVPAAGAR